MEAIAKVATEMRSALLSVGTWVILAGWGVGWWRESVAWPLAVGAGVVVHGTLSAMERLRAREPGLDERVYVLSGLFGAVAAGTFLIVWVTLCAWLLGWGWRP